QPGMATMTRPFWTENVAETRTLKFFVSPLMELLRESGSFVALSLHSVMRDSTGVVQDATSASSGGAQAARGIANIIHDRSFIGASYGERFSLPTRSLRYRRDHGPAVALIRRTILFASGLPSYPLARPQRIGSNRKQVLPTLLLVEGFRFFFFS